MKEYMNILMTIQHGGRKGRRMNPRHSTWCLSTSASMEPISQATSFCLFAFLSFSPSEIPVSPLLFSPCPLSLSPSLFLSFFGSLSRFLYLSSISLPFSISDSNCINISLFCIHNTYRLCLPGSHHILTPLFLMKKHFLYSAG